MKKLKLKKKGIYKSFIYILKNQYNSKYNYGFCMPYKSIILFNFFDLNIDIKLGCNLSLSSMRYLIKFLKYTLN